MKPSLPKDLARRLDRLSVAAHRFHRFAHHPLCAEYEGEVLRFGKARICRGCTLAALGGAVGVAAGLAAPRPPLALLAALAALGVVFAAALSWPRPKSPTFPKGTPEAEALTRTHRVPSPRSKLLTRFLPSALLGFSLPQGLRSGPEGWALAAFGTLLALAATLAYRRRGPQRRPCATCPERFAMHRCRGVQEILRRERAFQRLAGRIIASRSGTMS